MAARMRRRELPLRKGQGERGDGPVVASILTVVAATVGCIPDVAPPLPPSSAGGGLAPGRAAVSLTYDDALASQLDVAVPDLDRHGLLGTFFLTDTRSNP